MAEEVECFFCGTKFSEEDNQYKFPMISHKEGKDIFGCYVCYMSPPSFFQMNVSRSSPEALIIEHQSWCTNLILENMQIFFDYTLEEIRKR